MKAVDNVKSIHYRHALKFAPCGTLPMVPIWLADVREPSRIRCLMGVDALSQLSSSCSFPMCEQKESF